ncbi:MAG: hypothetical protein M0P49_00705 [Bacilli bacterium]|nr:hypothetical protein [Bacilli bacterium]
MEKKIVVIATSKSTLERDEIEKAMLFKSIQEYDQKEKDRIEALKIALESSKFDIEQYERKEDFNAKHKGKHGQSKNHPNHYARNRFGRR